jgi:trans-2,3-dihydro-3-hydroxyanthranilate isomerase
MRYRFLTTDVFTDRVFGGNPLAVFPEADGLTTEQMRQVAREFNLSETAFVLQAEQPDHLCRVRIFTPGTELPFAGHPTVGTAVVLAALGRIPQEGDEARVVFGEGVGPVPVVVRSGGGPAFAQLTAARAPERLAAPPAIDVLAPALSLDVVDLQADAAHQPEVWSAGVPFLFVPVKSLDALARARVDLAAWTPVAHALGFEEVFVFTTNSEGDGDVRARMFAPGMGIVEDPATGGAASAFAGYLGSRTATRDGTDRWVVIQGVEMGRRSRLEVEADKEGGVVTTARVGGTAVLVSEGTMEIPVG